MLKRIRNHFLTGILVAISPGVVIGVLRVIHPAKPRRRLRDNIFPPPTCVNGYGLGLLDEEWPVRAQVFIVNSYERERGEQ